MKDESKGGNADALRLGTRAREFGNAGALARNERERDRLGLFQIKLGPTRAGEGARVPVALPAFPRRPRSLAPLW